MTVGGFSNFDKLKDRKKLVPGSKLGKSKIDLDEMGNPIKREKSMTGVRERAKKPTQKKEPKMLTIYFRLLKKKIRHAPTHDDDQEEDMEDPECKT